MTTITLNDDLMNQVVQIGHYQNPQEAVIAILSDYLQTHLPKEKLFNQLRSNTNLSDEEIDSLFNSHQSVENKPKPTITKGDKTLNPTDFNADFKTFLLNSPKIEEIELERQCDYPKDIVF